MGREKKSDAPASNPRKVIRWKMSGEFLNRAYVDTVKNDSFEDTFSFHSWLTLENKIKIPKYNISGFVSVDARYDLEGDKNTYNDFDLLLREAYAQVKKSGLRFRLGRQILTWGKLDEVAILDIVNPQDYTESLLLSKQRRKEPVFMISADYSTETDYIEAFVIPWFKPNRIKFFSSDYAYFRYIRESILEGAYTGAAKQVVEDIRIEDEDIERSFGNIEVGARFGKRTARWDYSFYLMYIHDRTPALQENTLTGRLLKNFLYNPSAESLANLVAAGPNADDLKLIAEYKKMGVTGADFETTIGNFGVRGEVALFVSPLYLRDDFSVVEKERLSLGLGIDHTTADSLYINLQLVQDVILDYEDNIYNTERFAHQIIAIMNKEYLRGRFKPSLYCGHNFTYDDSFLNPELEYKPWDSLSLKLGTFIFEGNSDTLIGRYNTNDLIYTTAGYKF